MKRREFEKIKEKIHTVFDIVDRSYGRSNEDTILAYKDFKRRLEILGLTKYIVEVKYSKPTEVVKAMGKVSALRGFHDRRKEYDGVFFSFVTQEEICVIRFYFVKS